MSEKQRIIEHKSQGREREGSGGGKEKGTGRGGRVNNQDVRGGRSRGVWGKTFWIKEKWLMEGMEEV